MRIGSHHIEVWLTRSALAVASLSLASTVAAQAIEQPSTSSALIQSTLSSQAQMSSAPKAGDCFVRAIVPSSEVADAGTDGVSLSINDTPTNVHPRRSRSDRYEFPLRAPLMANWKVSIFVGTKQVLAKTVEWAAYDASTCLPSDERGIFEPSLLMGVVSDTFAPNDRENYPPGTAYNLKSKMVTRLQAELRPFGLRSLWSDGFWVGVEAIYGLRSSDLDCAGKDQKASLCTGLNALAPPSDPGAQLTANVLRASKIEAIVKPRFEFLTINKDTSVPIKWFVSSRFGFSQIPDAVKPANCLFGGAGFVISGGPYLGTGFEIVEGWDRGYRSHPDGDRTRMDFKFMFGPSRSIADQLPFLHNAAHSVRYLIEVVVDRNFHSSGPDSIQTYLGAVMDFRQLLGK